MADWIETLTARVNKKKEDVDNLKAKLSPIIDELRAVLEQDISRINKDIYSDKDGLSLITISDTHFQLWDQDKQLHSDIEFLVENSKLFLEPAGMNSEVFTLSLNNDVLDIFSISSQSLTFEQLSRKMIEPIIKNRFYLD